MNSQEKGARLDGEPVPPAVPDLDLIRPVGRGGFGQVWLATNRTTGNLRAVKLISLCETGSRNPAAREISSLARLEATNRCCHHPNLLHIDHVGKTVEHLFYVMDPADDASGGPATDREGYRPATLQSRLQNAPFAPEVCLDYARQLLAGLAALHAGGMVHRDVKPANCLFVDGQLKLADFGLLTEASPLVSRLGTQIYMPPDGRMDRRADVYATGLVLYEMLTGLPVDDFPSLGLQSKPIRSNSLLTHLLQLVLRACEQEPERRWADAQAMLAELTASSKTPSRCAARRWFIGASVAVAGLGVWALRPSPRVEISFVTIPYEARIYLDGMLQCDTLGKPWTTPCTIPDLSPRTYRVAFDYPGQPRWDAGSYDFSRTRQIVSRPSP